MAKDKESLNIPFHSPHLNVSTRRLVNEVIKSGWLTTGSKVAAFEDGVKELLDLKHALAVSSGTAALHLAYMLLDLKPGDEVIVPSLTFCSTINMIVHIGATPVFCDIDEKTLCVDPKDVQRKITKRTKAVVIVHFAGMPCDISALEKICKAKRIMLVEDAAHAFLTTYKGKRIGSHGNLTCFSFYATKVITCAEGGLLSSGSAEHVAQARILSLHGLSRGAWNRYAKDGSLSYQVLMPGYKYNLSDIHAAIGLSQLADVEKDREERQHFADVYRELLKDVPEIILPTDPPYSDSTHAWHLFTIQLRDVRKRDALIAHLKNVGIGTSIHFPPNHLQPYYRKCFGKISLPVTEKVGKRILSLPIYH